MSIKDHEGYVYMSTFNQKYPQLSPNFPRMYICMGRNLPPVGRYRGELDEQFADPPLPFCVIQRWQLKRPVLACLQQGWVIFSELLHLRQGAHFGPSASPRFIVKPLKDQ